VGGVRAGIRLGNMDTRKKIVDASHCRGKGRLVAVTGYFDPLLAWHARELERIRERAGALVVILLPLSGELLPLRGRAELVAALRMVDYVLIAENGDSDGLFAEIEPVEIVRLESDDFRRRGELMDHVRSRQIRS
jgi:glycerol-3-phosphate cytidylyltransferase-like family protein